jgi:membrane-associated phospholipid phosphatase
VLAFLTYVLMWVGFEQHWAWLDAADSSALQWLHSFGVRHPAWVTAWDVFCTVFGPTAFRLVALVVAVVALVKRNLRVALFLVISVGLSGFLTQIAKDVAARPRPSSALVQAPSYAFPSGHAVGVMVGVLALLTVLLPMLRRSMRVLAVTVGAVLVIAIGVGRIVLNVHNPSDVLAGWALGYLWFLACLLIVRPTSLSASVETPEAPGSAS